MNARPALATAALLLAAGGCVNLERSRDLGNPDVPAATLAAQVCSNCHGLDGNAPSPNFPSLAGQQKDYLEAQLRQFRGHNRLDPAGFEYMWGLSRKLTDAQIAGLADYFAAQRPRSPGPAAPALAEAGRRIFKDGLPDGNIPACATCHGEHGEGNATFPRLAYQHADYLYKQLVVFQRTDERPEGSVMKTIAHGLSGADMRAVAAYLQAFPD
ncbi:c-type cytochrome [Oryzomicrobium sp.]|uniref:c-type cytochrome n=1 Tax=Oryzomicrobium sp. TaxID=1911578 RepID=UPI0025F31CB0|nr:c-type cytochrome [Oryzomicrobium sp.]MCE1244509.1 cytochrome c4 [Oryzomicrobium sp.]